MSNCTDNSTNCVVSLYKSAGDMLYTDLSYNITADDTMTDIATPDEKTSIDKSLSVDIITTEQTINDIKAIAVRPSGRNRVIGGVGSKCITEMDLSGYRSVWGSRNAPSCFVQYGRTSYEIGQISNYPITETNMYGSSSHVSFTNRSSYTYALGSTDSGGNENACICGGKLSLIKITIDEYDTNRQLMCNKYNYNRGYWENVSVVDTIKKSNTLFLNSLNEHVNINTSPSCIYNYDDNEFVLSVTYIDDSSSRLVHNIYTCKDDEVFKWKKVGVLDGINCEITASIDDYVGRHSVNYGGVRITARRPGDYYEFILSVSENPGLLNDIEISLSGVAPTTIDIEIKSFPMSIADVFEALVNNYNISEEYIVERNGGFNEFNEDISITSDGEFAHFSSTATPGDVITLQIDYYSSFDIRTRLAYGNEELMLVSAVNINYTMSAIVGKSPPTAVTFSASWPYMAAYKSSNNGRTWANNGGVRVASSGGLSGVASALETEINPSNDPINILEYFADTESNAIGGNTSNTSLSDVSIKFALAFDSISGNFIIWNRLTGLLDRKYRIKGITSTSEHWRWRTIGTADFTGGDLLRNDKYVDNDSFNIEDLDCVSYNQDVSYLIVQCAPNAPTSIPSNDDTRYIVVLPYYIASKDNNSYEPMLSLNYYPSVNRAVSNNSADYYVLFGQLSIEESAIAFNASTVKDAPVSDRNGIVKPLATIWQDQLVVEYEGSYERNRSLSISNRWIKSIDIYNMQNVELPTIAYTNPGAGYTTYLPNPSTWQYITPVGPVTSNAQKFYFDCDGVNSNYLYSNDVVISSNTNDFTSGKVNAIWGYATSDTTNALTIPITELVLRNITGVSGVFNVVRVAVEFYRSAAQTTYIRLVDAVNGVAITSYAIDIQPDVDTIELAFYLMADSAYATNIGSSDGMRASLYIRHNNNPKEWITVYDRNRTFTTAIVATFTPIVSWGARTLHRSNSPGVVYSSLYESFSHSFYYSPSADDVAKNPKLVNPIDSENFSYKAEGLSYANTKYSGVDLLGRKARSCYVDTPFGFSFSLSGIAIHDASFLINRDNRARSLRMVADVFSDNAMLVPDLNLWESGGVFSLGMASLSRENANKVIFNNTRIWGARLELYDSYEDQNFISNHTIVENYRSYIILNAYKGMVVLDTTEDIRKYFDIDSSYLLASTGGVTVVALYEIAEIGSDYIVIEGEFNPMHVITKIFLCKENFVIDLDAISEDPTQQKYPAYVKITMGNIVYPSMNFSAQARIGSVTFGYMLEATRLISSYASSHASQKNTSTNTRSFANNMMKRRNNHTLEFELLDYTTRTYRVMELMNTLFNNDEIYLLIDKLVSDGEINRESWTDPRICTAEVSAETGGSYGNIGKLKIDLMEM